MNCLIENCNNPSHTRGLCRQHYHIAYKNGLIEIKRRNKKPKEKCSVENCGRDCSYKNLCRMHYKRVKKNGTVEPKEVIIDKTNWTEANIAWVAGIIEGEGNFTLNLNKTGLRLRVSMTDLDVLEKCYEITKCGTINGPYSRGGKYKDYWTWAVQSKSKAKELIKVIYPLLLSRRKNKIDCLKREIEELKNKTREEKINEVL